MERTIEILRGKETKFIHFIAKKKRYDKRRTKNNSFCHSFQKTRKRDKNIYSNKMEAKIQSDILWND